MKDKTEPLTGWRRHLLLISGIALPFALMAFVLIYQTIVQAAVPAPRYAAVYGFSNTGYNAPYFKFKVVDGRLQVSYRPPVTEEQKNNFRYNSPHAVLYIQHDYKKTAKKFILPVPTAATETKSTEQKAGETTAEIAVPLPPELNVDLIEGRIAPDGYMYNLENGHSGTLFTDIFVGSSYRGPLPSVENGPRRIPLMFDPKSEDSSYLYYYIGDLNFLGWVKEPLP